MAIDKLSGKAWTSLNGVTGVAKSSIAKVAGIAKPSSASGIKTSNLVMHLDAGNSSSYSGSGTDWLDLTTNGIDATIEGGATYSSTEGGGSFYFDGVNDHYHIPYADASQIRIGEDSGEVNYVGRSPTRTYGDVDTDGGMTVHVWAKLPSNPTKHLFGFANNSVISASGNPSNTYLFYQGVEFQYIKDGRVRLFCFGGNGSNGPESRIVVAATASFHTPNIGDWVNIVGVIDDDLRSGNTFSGRVFINGVKATGSYIDNPGNGTGPGLGYRMKERSTQTDKYDAGGVLSRGYFSQGYIAEVAVYNESLSDSDVLANFNATKSRYGYT